MNASDFRHKQGVRWQEPGRYGYTSIKCLEFLEGRQWDEIALAYVGSLRPSMIRVVDAEETCDAQPWRVTVYIDGALNVITGIRQEVAIWLPEGIENGHDLSSKINFVDD